MNATIELNADKASQAVMAYLKSRVSWQWASVARTIKGDLKSTVAAHIESDQRSTRTTTDLYNWNLPALSAIRAFKRAVLGYWEEITVDWVDDGVRLIPKTKVAQFEEYMANATATLAELANAVQEQRDEIMAEAKDRRGKAFNAADYPSDLSKMFAMSWGYEPLTVSKELRDISEGAFAAEQTRQTMRILGAVQLAEEAKLRTLATLASNLIERLTPKDDGKKTRLRDAAVENLRELCDTFSEVVLWGCDEVTEAVNEAGSVIQGITAEDLRESAELKTQVAERLRTVVGMIAGLGVEDA